MSMESVKISFGDTAFSLPSALGKVGKVCYAEAYYTLLVFLSYSFKILHIGLLTVINIWVGVLDEEDNVHRASLVLLIEGRFSFKCQQVFLVSSKMYWKSFFC